MSCYLVLSAQNDAIDSPNPVFLDRDLLRDTIDAGLSTIYISKGAEHLEQDLT